MYAAAYIAASVAGFFYEIHFWAQIGFLVAVLMGTLFAEGRDEQKNSPAARR